VEDDRRVVTRPLPPNGAHGGIDGAARRTRARARHARRDDGARCARDGARRRATTATLDGDDDGDDDDDDDATTRDDDATRGRRRRPRPRDGDGDGATRAVDDDARDG
jgi:hypothetical protein